jgi:arginine N-succinyltransferase
MIFIRDARLSDHAALLELARLLDTVNLPSDGKEVAALLERSEASFAGRVPPESRVYVFVLEEDGRLGGTCSIHAQHGTRRAPHVYFDVLEESRYSETLDVQRSHRVLRIGYDFDGPTEIGGLVLRPELRAARLGRFLAFVRFAFMASRREAFRDQVLAELLPPLEPDGRSLLWEHLGRRFTGLSYQEADRLSVHNKEFIRALFPQDPICASLLPEEVRGLIGRVGPSAAPVERMLRGVGFDYARRIDPFDGGPHFVARTDAITPVRSTFRARARAGQGEARAIVATGERGYRACLAAYSPAGDEVVVSPEALATVGASSGDALWVTPL